jgi:hypothetical protein
VRALLLLFLASCAAAPPQDEFPGKGTLPYRTSHEIAWQALCQVSAREAEGGTLRVDSATWEIRCGDRFLCHAPPGGGPALVSFSDDIDWYLRFSSRFHETLARLQKGAGDTTGRG